MVKLSLARRPLEKQRGLVPAFLVLVGIAHLKKMFAALPVVKWAKWLKNYQGNTSRVMISSKTLKIKLLSQALHQGKGGWS